MTGSLLGIGVCHVSPTVGRYFDIGVRDLHVDQGQYGLCFMFHVILTLQRPHTFLHT